MFLEERRKLTGERIKACRRSMHLTQKELLDKLFLSQSSVGSLRAWERGERLPDTDTLARMCQLFDCDFGFLIGDYPEKKRDVADVRKITGLSAEAVNTICFMTQNGKQDVLNAVVSNYHFFKLLGLIFRLSKAKQKSDLEKLFSSQFGDISEEYVYEAVATSTATKLISEIADELRKGPENG
jgi:transcriptional regulator with XRE-family HTH domain